MIPNRASKAVPTAIFVSLVFFAPIVSAQVKRDALVEYRQGDYAAAVEVCLTEISAAPENMDSYAVLCWSLVGLSRFDDAARYAERALQVNRYDPRIVEVLGEARFNQGRNEEALKLFQDYVTLTPEGGRIDTVYYLMGEIYARMGRFRHADISFSTAVRYVPGNASWWTRLGYARERAGENDHAAQAYEKALSLDPQYADARLGLSRTRKALSGR